MPVNNTILKSQFTSDQNQMLLKFKTLTCHMNGKHIRHL